VSSHENIPNDQLALLDAVCDRFQAAWNSGERPVIETFLN